MKQFLYWIFLAVIVARCNDNSATAGKESKTTVNEEAENNAASDNTEPGINDVDVDTIGMAEFLAMKAAAARNSQSNGIQSDNITGVNDIDVDTVGFAAFKRQKAEMARQSYEDSIRRAEIIAERKRYNAARISANNRTSRGSKQTQSAGQDVATSEEEVEQNPDTVKEKKGWSKKAKGAVIGAATGAAAGAVINKKNRKAGGVVGGVVGAAAGYGIGRHKDKKDEKKDTTVIEQQ